MKFNVSPGPPEPLDRPGLAGRARPLPGFLDYFFAPGATEAWIAEFPACDFQVGAEDMALVEGVQAGRGERLRRRTGGCSRHDEQLIARFQAYVRAPSSPSSTAPPDRSRPFTGCSRSGHARATRCGPAASIL